MSGWYELFSASRSPRHAASTHSRRRAENKTTNPKKTYVAICKKSSMDTIAYNIEAAPVSSCTLKPRRPFRCPPSSGSELQLIRPRVTFRQLLHGVSIHWLEIGAVLVRALV